MRCCPLQARELYRLLVEDSRAIRQAAAELVAGMLEPQGKRFIAQVRARRIGRLQQRMTKLPFAVVCCSKGSGVGAELIESMHRPIHDGCTVPRKDRDGQSRSVQAQ